jgi:bacillopeptidase F
MKRLKSRKRNLVAILMIFLLLGTIFPIKGGAVQNGVSNPNPVEGKVDPKVIHAFEKNKYTNVIVELKNQADVEQIAKQAREEAKKVKATRYQEKLRVRSTVVSGLQTNAEQTQYHIKHFIRQKKAEGKLKDDQSYYIVNAVSFTSTKEVLQEIAAFPEVNHIYLNERHALPKPKTSGVQKLTSELPWNLEKIQAKKAWENGLDGSGVVIATLDSGVDVNHPSLKNQYRGLNADGTFTHTFNWLDLVGDSPTPIDSHGHGTHVTGTMVGYDPETGMRTGVAPGARWIAVRAFSENGALDTDLLKAGEWLLAPLDEKGTPHPEMAPDIINNSWGGSSTLNDWFRSIVKAWAAADITPVFAAGNHSDVTPVGPGSITNPANYPEAIAVGSTDSANQISWFSLRGPSPYGGSEIKPDLVAPGEEILSTLPNNEYGLSSGTSMAAPHVSGAIAILKQMQPNMQIDKLKETLYAGLIPLSDSKYPSSPNDAYGRGIIDLTGIVKSGSNGVGSLVGKVGYKAVDKKKPVASHEPLPYAYANAPLKLSVQASDDFAVSTVELHYQVDRAPEQTSNGTLFKGNFKSGSYSSELPLEQVEGKKITYYWKITDYAGNSTKTVPVRLPLKEGVSVGYATDFETTPVGWYSTGRNSSWNWGKVMTPVLKVPSGTNAYSTTNLDWRNTDMNWSYNNNEDSMLTMPPIQVKKGEAVFLNFKQTLAFPLKFRVEDDYGQVLVSEDMKNWHVAKTNEEHLETKWEAVSVDLSSFSGKTVYVAYRFHSDSMNTSLGWYLDDVAIEAKPSGDVYQPSQSTTAFKPFGEATRLQGTHEKQVLIPLSAQIQIVENGRLLATDPTDGSFSMKMPADEYHLLAEAYGFNQKIQTARVSKDASTNVDIQLSPLDKGVVKGTVKNSESKKTIKGATVKLIEDSAVAPVRTGENGKYSLNPFIGTYTLEVSAPYFHTYRERIEIKGNSIRSIDIHLKPYIGTEGEISYDDGSAEDAYLVSGMDEIAVKMSLKDGQEQALLTAGLFYIGPGWSNLSVANFQVDVYDATGPEGGPGKKLTESIAAKSDVVLPGWVRVDLSPYSIHVSKEYFLVFSTQAPDHQYIPTLGFDFSSPFSDRLWKLYRGTWLKVFAGDMWDVANPMIRSVVSYETELIDNVAPAKPIVNEVTDISTSVTGTAEVGSSITVKAGTTVLGTATANSDGKYSVTIAKQKAETKLKVTAMDEAGNVSEVKEVTVKDKTAPTVPTVNAVYDNATSIIGKAESNTKVYAMVGSKKIGEATAKNGAFTITITKQKAGTSISVYAVDTAGNKSASKTVKVIDKTAPTVPTVNAVYDNATSITGKAESNAKVHAMVGSKKIGEATAKNGAYIITITKQKAGTSTFVYAVDTAGNKSASKTVKVIDKTAPSVPTVNKISSKSVTATGKGEKGVSIYIYNGSKKIGQGIVDIRGNYKVKIKAQKKGSTLKVYAQDKSGNKSKSKTVKVS